MLDQDILDDFTTILEFTTYFCMTFSVPPMLLSFGASTSQ